MRLLPRRRRVVASKVKILVPIWIVISLNMPGFIPQSEAQSHVGRRPRASSLGGCYVCPAMIIRMGGCIRGVRHGLSRRTRFPDSLLISRRDFSLISQMRMREMSTAHAQTQKGCFSREDFLISRGFLADFLISTGFSRP